MTIFHIVEGPSHKQAENAKQRVLLLIQMFLQASIVCVMRDKIIEGNTYLL